jgi:anti-sigma factor RsiW
MSADLPITEADLQAYADGRLADARRAEIEAWLASRPEEAERVEAYRRIHEELRAVYDPVLQEPVPERLHAAATHPRRRLGRYGVAAGWLVAGLIAGGIGGWQLHERGGLAPPPAAEAPNFVRRAAVAHATYSPEVRHPVEVGADQEDHLVAWLSKRLGAPIRAPKLESVGYSLVGGRLLPGDNGPVAHFMYQCSRGTRVTLYLRTEQGPHRETAFRYARENNVGVFYWVDRRMGYALSSADIGKDELLNVANAVYRQLNP